MDFKYYHKVDNNITKEAKNIFGDIVVDAGIIDHVFDHEELQVKLSIRNQYNKITSDGDINLQHGDIYVKFITGNMVMFSTSEWGNVTKVNASIEY